MCSLGDDNFDTDEASKYLPSKPEISLTSKCNKCKERQPFVVLRFKDKYCKQCFLEGTTHKFKSLLGKHKLIRPNERVLIIHKAGHASSALLHFIRSGLDRETPKNLRFVPVFIFIEDNVTLSLSARKEILRKIDEEVKRYNFSLYFSSLCEIFLSTVVKEDYLKTDYELLQIKEDDGIKLKDFYTQFGSNRTKQIEYLRIATKATWIKIAKKLDCKFIFTPDISVDIASELLSSISLGRGSHISLESGFCDDRDEEVKLLKPLRLFDAKELAIYNYINNIAPVTFQKGKEKFTQSVQNIMEKFVNNLQTNYPATITTILKTGDKLSSTNETIAKCHFCQAPIDNSSTALCSAESTEFSHWTSTHTLDYDLTSQQRYEFLLKSFSTVSCNDYCFTCKALQK